MTDIGKIVLYHGSILKREAANGEVLLKSGYRVEDRTRYNPSWKMPQSVTVDEDGYMSVWYPDGTDDLEEAGELVYASATTRHAEC